MMEDGRSGRSKYLGEETLRRHYSTPLDPPGGRLTRLEQH
jgi:hypothetical protein